MRETFELKVHLARDEQTGRWYIAESEIPGLWLEAATPTELMDRIALAAPEMIQLNETEIIESCRARASHHPFTNGSGPRARPSIRPVFDSPFELTYA